MCRNFIFLLIITFWAPQFSFSKEMSAAFFDLKGTGLSDDKSKELSDRFLTEIYRTKGFKIITTKELWNLLQKESVQKATQFEDFDVNERSLNTIEESNLIKYLAHTSMLLNIDAIIMGTLSITDSNLYISAKLIKAKDGQVITMANKECNISNKDSLNNAFMVIANEIAEPTGVLVYKEQVRKNDAGGIQDILKGFGRRNPEGKFEYDKNEGLWSFAPRIIVISSNPVNVNYSKYKIECVNKNKRGELIIKAYGNNNNLLEMVNAKDTACGDNYLYDGQMQIFFPNGATSLNALFKNGYLVNAAWLNECGDTMASFKSDMGKYKNMNIYNTDTTYAQSSISYGKLIYKNYTIDEDDNKAPWGENYCKNNSNYEDKCCCYVIVKRNDRIDYNYLSFRNLLKHGLIISYYPNGIKKDSAFVIYGKIIGKRVERYDNGKLQEITNWKNGVQDGEQISFWDNGNAQTKYFFQNSVLNGEKKDYWENGKLKSKVNVTYGKTEKPYYGYNDDGSKFEYFPIYNGIFNGVDTEFSDGGKSINSLTFWKNDKVLMGYVRIFISDDYTRCKATKYEYFDGIPKVNDTDTTTISSEISLEYKNNKYNKYYMDLNERSSYDKIQISDNDNWHMEDFQILLNAIEFKKKHYKTKNNKE